MKEYEGIIIDENNASIGDWITLLEDNSNPISILNFADKIVVGGVKHLPLFDLPKVYTAIMRFLTDNQNYLAIAISSMQNHLKEEE